MSNANPWSEFKLTGRLTSLSEADDLFHIRHDLLPHTFLTVSNPLNHPSESYPKELFSLRVTSVSTWNQRATWEYRFSLPDAHQDLLEFGSKVAASVNHTMTHPQIHPLELNPVIEEDLQRCYRNIVTLATYIIEETPPLPSNAAGTEVESDSESDDTVSVQSSSDSLMKYQVNDPQSTLLGDQNSSRFGSNISENAEVQSMMTDSTTTLHESDEGLGVGKSCRSMTMDSQSTTESTDSWKGTTAKFEAGSMFTLVDDPMDEFTDPQSLKGATTSITDSDEINDSESEKGKSAMDEGKSEDETPNLLKMLVDRCTQLSRTADVPLEHQGSPH